MNKQKIIFRVDGGSSIGLGHITRCCALADMLKDNFEIYFYTRADSKIIIEDIKKYCTDVFQMNGKIFYEEEASEWVKVLSGDEIVVLDGYNFNTKYQHIIKNKGCKLVCIDDIHAYHFVADTVINHAPGVDKKAYSTEPYTRLYIGTDYALLKKLFLDAASVQRTSINLEESPVLVCFGGADPNNFTKEALEKIMQMFPGKKINVIVGAAYLHTESLAAIVVTNKRVLLHKNIKPEEMLVLMRQSHIAITSASTIALEYICVKGNLFLKCIADNQKEIYQALIEKECAYPFEMLYDNIYSKKNITNQFKLIDGKNTDRYLAIFNEVLFNAQPFFFKKAEYMDAELLFNWINDSEVRAQSLSKSEISYTDHMQWFSKKIADNNCYLYIVYKKNSPAGMIRFDVNNNESTISYLVDKQHRGQGIGFNLLHDGIQKFLQEVNFKGTLKAVVKESNPASLKIFVKEGFENDGRSENLVHLKKILDYEESSNSWKRN